MKSSVLDLVVDRLKTYVTSEEVEIDTKLPAEMRLAEMFGVARPTMREACRILESNGYVKRIPGRGMFLVSKKPEGQDSTALSWLKEHKFELEEVFNVRLALEGLAINEVIEKNTYPAILERLMENYSALATEKFIKNHAREYTRLDEEFHQIIIDASGNGLLSNIFQTIMTPVIRGMRTVSFGSEINWRNACRAHQRIITAMQQNNRYSIKDALEDHVRQTRALFYLEDN